MNEILSRKETWNKFLFFNNEEVRYIIKIDYYKDLPERPIPCHDNVSKRIDWALRKYEMQMKQLNWLNDDKVPYLDVYTGTEIFAEAFGCKVQRPENDMPFALPLIKSANEVNKIEVPTINDTPLKEIFFIADELKKRAEKDAIFKLPDIQTPMDIAALIWDKSDFFMAMIESPKAVKQLSAKVKTLLFEFLDKWFARYGKELVAHYPDYYLPQGVTLSADEIGTINNDMFNKYFLPELKETSLRYQGLGIHCCANSRHQWKHIKKIPGLKLLNLVQPKEVLKEAYSYFADFVPQMHSWVGDGRPETWMENYPENAKVVIEVKADSKDNAKRLADELKLACDKIK